MPAAPPHGSTTEATQFAHDAAAALAEARGQLATLHQPGQRDAYRARLARAIDLAERALATERAAEPDAVSAAALRATLAQAHAARAEDALHGARQLSLSAQRAPTLDACHAGWRRVEQIVAGAEDSARAASTAAKELSQTAPGTKSDRAAHSAAERAEAAAQAARTLIAERNDAYTFHTDGGFSFGEGWYVAAAAVLAGAAIQIEPGQPGTARAERFLRDAGLANYLQGYRPRPRAVKQTTEILARAFRADPALARRRLREAFLGNGGVPPEVSAWADAKLPGATRTAKVLLWVRDGVHHPGRNTRGDELAELAARARAAGLLPLIVGEAVRDGEFPRGAVDLTRFSRDPVFQGEDTRRAQLQFFEHLVRAHGLVGQLGVTTAGMDGPALMGLPTLYLTDAPNVRMGTWVGAVPGYEEVVRDEGYLDRVSGTLASWASGGLAPRG